MGGRALPARLALGPNYPNPFNPSTIIPYQLAASSHVRLEVFNLLGQRIATLVDGERAAGFHTATWHAVDGAGRAVAAGVYIYRMKVGEEHQTGRMVLIDGQTGIPAAGAAGPMPMQASALERVEADAGVYGLIVSGAGLVAYVDPAFRVGVDEADIVVEEYSGIPRMKLAVGGILGDVDNNERVDFFDALLVALYSGNASIVMPNNGDISLGDVNADGRVDLTDAWLIAAYLNDPSDPSLPAGIGEPVGETTTTASQMWKLYWTEWDTESIRRSNLDGSGVEDLVITGLDAPNSIALDVAGGKMYWTDAGTDKIQRSNLDGSGVEDLVITGLDGPGGIALDVAGGKMYWTDGIEDKIQRSNLDGSGVEDLVTTGLDGPVSLALDVADGKMYWADTIADKIQRSNLDGSGVEDLVTTGLDAPRGLALDVAGGKLYWTNSDTDKIQRSNLDGSGVEDLATTGFWEPRGLALDVAGGKMYWTHSRAKISRSNLDGSGVEDLFTRLAWPLGIALGYVPVEAGPDSAEADEYTPVDWITLTDGGGIEITFETSIVRDNANNLGSGHSRYSIEAEAGGGCYRLFDTCRVGSKLSEDESCAFVDSDGFFLVNGTGCLLGGSTYCTESGALELGIFEAAHRGGYFEILKLPGDPLNTTVIGTSRWQHRVGESEWLDVEETVRDGVVCGNLLPDEPGEYRWVVHIEMEGQTGSYASANTLIQR